MMHCRQALNVALVVLTAGLAALAGCIKLAPLATSLEPAAMQGDVVVKAAGALTVNVVGDFSVLRGIQAKTSDISTVSIEIAGSGYSKSQAIGKAALASGGASASATFSALLPGKTTATITAYDGSNTNIGSASGSASVQSGQTSTLNLTLQLVPTYVLTTPTPSPTPTVAPGALSLGMTILDGPTIYLTPTPQPTPTPHPPGVYVRYDYLSAGPSMTYDLKITEAPSPGPGVGVFWSNEFTIGSGSAGPTTEAYIGLQIVQQIRKVVFSVWEADGSDKGNPFGNEGSGYQYIAAYDWLPGRSYRLEAGRTSEDASHSYWTGWITDVTTGEKLQLATHRLPVQYGSLIVRNSVWTEYFLDKICEVALTKARFANVKVGGATPSKAQTAYNMFSTCPLSNVSYLGGYEVELAAGQGVSRTTPENAVLW